VPGVRAHKLQVGIIAGVTGASVLAAVLVVLPLPMWDYVFVVADYPGRRMPTPQLFGWAFLIGLAVGAPLGALVWKLPLPTRWHPVRNVTAVLLGTGMATIPVVFILVPNALGGVLMAVPGLAMAIAVTYRAQRHRRVPLRYCMVAVVWGGTFAITAGHHLLWAVHAGVASWLQGRLTAVGPVLPSPLWEEIVKGLGVLALFDHLRRRYDSPVHGFVLGAMVGAGFNFVETSRYAMYDFSTAIFQVWVRQWVSGVAFGHVLFTGLIGTAIALAYRQRHAIAGLAIAAGGFGLGIVAHYVWNWTVLTRRQPITFDDAILGTLFGYLLNYLILSGPFLLLIVVTLVLADRRERAELSAGLIAEARGGQAAVSQGEAIVLAHPKLRRVHRLSCARMLGWRAYSAVGHLHQLQLDLAYERFRLAREVGRIPPVSPRVLRQEIQALRRRINAPMEVAS
jgi:RsiW-degrading membrane proteinase PrsW (M82 family)